MAGCEDSGLDTLSNDINAELKNKLDIAVANSDFNQRTVLSAVIEQGLSRDPDGVFCLDEENLELEKWREHYA